MINIALEWKGLDKLVAKLGLLEKTAILELNASMELLLVAIEEALKQKIEEQGLVKSGDLMNSVEVVKASVLPGLEFKADMTVNVPYALIHEYGGVIKAKSGVMKFEVEEGEWRQAEMVVIPAKPFMQPVLDDLNSMVEKILLEGMQFNLQVTYSFHFTLANFRGAHTQYTPNIKLLLTIFDWAPEDYKGHFCGFTNLMDRLAILLNKLCEDVSDRPITVEGQLKRSAGTVCLQTLLQTDDIADKIIRLNKPEAIETPSVILQLLDDKPDTGAPGYLIEMAIMDSIQITCIADEGEQVVSIANRIQGLLLESITNTDTHLFNISRVSRSEDYDEDLKIYRTILRYKIRSIENQQEVQKWLMAKIRDK